jgi:hypothetical protein
MVRCILGGDAQRLRTQICADAARQWKFSQKGDKEATGSGANVQNADWPRAPALFFYKRQRRLYQRFAVGTRVENCRRDNETTAVEFTMPQDARDGLTSAASFHKFNE